MSKKNGKNKNMKKEPIENKRKTPALIGYMRISTEMQDTSLQYDALISAGVDPENIYKDIISGSKIDRSGLNKCLESMIEGDTLVVWKIDRLSRSLKDLLTKLEMLNDRGIGFKSVTQPINTTTPAGRMMMQIIGAFGEFEREMIRQRVSAGIQAKMKKNPDMQWGRRPQTDYDDDEVLNLLEQGKSYREVAKEIGISKSTVARIVKKDRSN